MAKRRRRNWTIELTEGDRERGGRLGWEGRMLLMGAAAAAGIGTLAYVALSAYLGWLICTKVLTRPILALDKVTAGYGLITVLNNVSIRLHPREIVAVLGADGSGKSTILKTSAGLTRVLSGAVSFRRRGRDPLASAPPCGRGPRLRAADAQRLPGPDRCGRGRHGMGAFLRPKSFARDVEAVFALFPRIRERSRHAALACTLSGGERRMLSIALTLLLKPRALLLDERAATFSPSGRHGLRGDRAHSQRARDPDPARVEQNVNKALALATRVAVLVRGREALDCPVADVRLDVLKRLFMDGGVEDDGMIGKPPPWPNGARLAVAVSFDVDADSVVHASHRAGARGAGRDRAHALRPPCRPAASRRPVQVLRRADHLLRTGLGGRRLSQLGRIHPDRPERDRPSRPLPRMAEPGRRPGSQARSR